MSSRGAMSMLMATGLAAVAAVSSARSARVVVAASCACSAETVASNWGPRTCPVKEASSSTHGMQR